MNYQKYLKRLKRIILDAVYPPRCENCGKLLIGGALCDKCKEELVAISSPVCHKCGASLSDHDSHRCSGFGAEFVAAYYYGGMVRRLIIDFKNDAYDDIFNEFFDDVRDKINQEYSNIKFDKTVCVPSYDKYKHTSSSYMAQRIAKEFRLEFEHNTLVKYRETKKQHSLDQLSRMVNLENSIKVTEGKEKSVRGKTILLCDDVKSTGSTLKECANALYDAGAEKVCCVCIAMSDYVRKKPE